MDTKRCFFAVKLPKIDQYRQKLVEINSQHDVRMSITRNDQYHLTLQFYSDLAESEVNKVIDELEHIPVEPFSLSLVGTGVIPANKPKKTRVLYVDTQLGTTNLQHLVNILRTKLRQLGLEVESRTYLPHLTVARIKHGRDREQVHESWMRSTFDALEVKIDRIYLIESQLTPEGPIYTDLGEFELKKE